MKLFNIGGEGQLYIGAIIAAAAGLYLGGLGWPLPVGSRRWSSRGRWAARRGALIPGFLRAFFWTSEIITSLMLNYVAAHLLDVPDLQHRSRTSARPRGLQRDRVPAPARAARQRHLAGWTIHVQGGLPIPLGALLAGLVAVGLWLLYSRTRFGFEVQVLGDSVPRRATRGCARAGRSSR